MRTHDAAVLSLALAGCACARGDARRGSIILATTTSTQDSGLLDVLVPRFTTETGVEVKVIAVGSGAALQMAARGDADVVLSHAPSAEAKRVAAGDLVEGRLVMHNDFVLVGPPDDPAGVRGAAGVDAAMRAIAARGGFASRGDESGTHQKELELWKGAGVEVASVPRREETGQGMGATLYVADQKRLYALTDRGTYLALRPRLGLVVVFAGAPALLNVYQAYLVSPARHAGVEAEAGRRFLAFLVAAETQRLIGGFMKAEYGEPLFVPDAGKDPASLGLR